jgi:hypothetical protein
VSDPEALVRLLNAGDTAAAPSAVETVAAGSAADGAGTADPDLATSDAAPAVPGAVETAAADGASAPTPVVASAADFDVIGAVSRLNDALGQLFDGTGEEAALTPEAEAANPELAAVSKEMIAMARAQAEAMERGETLLQIPVPLGAERSAKVLADRCWDGASITVDSLPTVLLWMDILSISTNLDIVEVRADNRLLFMEAALNPEQISACLARSDSDYAAALLANSEFLRETARNELFAAFLFRNVPRYPLDIAGVSLEGERYAQLADGRKLSVGSAPAVDSRVAVIGDLGLLIRVADGYRVNLYPNDMGWFVSGG